eukprot:7736037-Pyramimonas_sp.AAC.1
MDKYGHSCFGCWPEWGSVWDARVNVQRFFYDGAEPEDEEAALERDESIDVEVVEMLEVVDLASLRRYAAQKVDRRQEFVDAYIDRLEREGQVQ